MKLADQMKITIKTDLDDSLAKEKLNNLLNSSKNKKVKLTADTSEVTNSLNAVLTTLKQINSMSKSFSLGGISVKNSGVSKTLSEFKALTNQYNSLQKQLSKETNPKSMSILKTQLNEVGNSINKVKSQLSSAEQSMAKAFTTTSTQKLEASLSKTFSSISSKAKTLGTEIQSAFNNPNMNMTQLNSLQTRFQGLQNLIQNFDMSKMSGESLNNLLTKVSELENKFKALNTASNQTKLENKFNIDCTKAISQLEQLRAKYTSLGRDTSGIDNLIAKTKELQVGVGTVNFGNLQNGLSNVNKQIVQMKSSVSALNSVKTTFGQIFQSFSMFAPGFLIGSSLVSGIRSIKTEILDLDKAMTNLIKVANDNDVNTQTKLKGITDNAVNTAKEVAGSVSGVVESMAEATKMGIKGGMDAVQEVAKFSQIFSNVGDIDINAATSGIATIVNAFDIDPLKEYSVTVDGVTKKTTSLANSMDILNHAGNNYAIGVDGVLEAMQNGGATMASYGLSIQESTALITASNEAIQNPSRVGNGLKALTVNLAGLKTSADTGTISLNKTGIALKTIAGIDIFTDKSQTKVKSMTTLLDEVNAKWDDLTDKERKGLANAIAGKQQSAVFNSLMKNYDTYKQMMNEYSNGDQFNSAIKENEKYIDSIQGKIASLKATWTGIGSSIFNSNMIKGGVSALDGFSQGIDVVIRAIDKLNLGIPTTIAGIALLKTAFSSFRYAESFSAGISLIGMKLASIPGDITKMVKGIPLALSAFTGLNVTMLGLAGTIGAVALAFGGIALAIKTVNDNNTRATKKWDELNTSVKEHKKAIADANKQEDGLASKLKKYQELSNVTNKTKEQQKEYNKTLQELAKIDPDLVIYNEKGSPVKARVGEVQDLIREYQKAQREQQKLLNRDLKEKADNSFDKYKEQSGDRNKKLFELDQLKRKLLENENKATGQYESKLSGDWLTKMLAGNTNSIKYTQQYFKNLEEYKKKEQEVLDSITQQRQNVSKDQSDWLGNLFNTNENLEGAGKNRQKALENALKLDFSQFDKDDMESLGNKLNDWFSTTDYKNTGKFNEQINQVDKLNQAWKDGDITSKAYKTSVDDIASTLSKLTGGKISTEEFAKMLKLPEFDVESAHKTFSDLEEAQNTLKAKIADMGVLESPKQRLELAYDIIQDEKVPEEIKNKVAEFASDGNITDEELKLLLNLTAELKDDDLENTVNEKIDKLSEEKEVTQKIAIKYAMQVDSASDNNQYLEELLGDANLAMDIQIHMDTNDLDSLKEDLKGIPVEKQVGIIVSAVNSGKYTPEQLRSFIELLPEQKQVDVINSIQQSGTMTPEQLKELINGLPDEVKKRISVSTPGADESNNKLNQVDENSKSKDKKVKTSAPGADETISKEKQVDKNSGNKTKRVDVSAPGGLTAAQTLAQINERTYNKKQTITTVFKTIGKAVSNFFGGGYQPPVIKSVGGFSNVSDTPQEASQPTTMSTGFSGVSDSPTMASGTPSTQTTINPTSQVSAKAKTNPIDTIFTSSTKSTKISTSLKHVWDTIKYGVNLLQELENRIKRVANNVDLLDSKMEHATDKKKITYLEQQNKLYKEQSSLTKSLYSKLNSEKNSVYKKVKDYGFKANSQGNISNYDEQMTKLEAAAAAAEKKSSNYKGKSDKTKNALEKSADKAREKLENAKKATERYMELQLTEIPSARKEWQDLQNTIKDNNNEIEKLKLNLKTLKKESGITANNYKKDDLESTLNRLNTKSENAQGIEKINILNKQNDVLKEQVALNSKNIELYKQEKKDYRDQLRKYGAKFDENGMMTNMSSVLSKYANTDDYDKVKEWVDSYADLSKAQDDLRDENAELNDQIIDTANEIKNLKLEQSLKPYNNALDESNSKIKSLQNNLDVLSIKFDNAYGADKLEILKQQIELQKQLKEEQDKQLDALNKKENTLQDELSKNGFKFDGLGNITNMDTTLKKLENTGSYEYVKSVLEQWKEVHEDEIPDAIKSIEDYEKAIQDSYNNQLNITKEIEDKIKSIYEKQLEDRKKAIEKETETVKTELEKQKKAYQDSRKEVDYQNEYSEKTDEIAKLEKDLANAKKDTSIGNKKKIAELEKQLADAKKDLDKFVQDKIDSDIEKGFDDAINSVEDKNNQKIEDLEKEWTDSKIAEAIKNALSTGIFTDIDGQVSNLQDAMLNFAETSGEAFGVMGTVIKEQLVANLGVALDTLKNYSEVLDGLGLNNIGTNLPTGQILNKSVNTGDISINITTQSNANEKDIANEVKKAVNDALSGTVQGL